MCNFWSCVVGENLNVYRIIGQDDHNTIFENFDLPDTDRIKYARIEINPSRKIPTDPLESWRFCIDERIRPEWFSPAHEKACWDRLKDEFDGFMKFFYGSLNLSGCDLSGVKLPESVGGSLYLSGCDLSGLKLPESVGGKIYK